MAEITEQELFAHSRSPEFLIGEQRKLVLFNALQELPTIHEVSPVTILPDDMFTSSVPIGPHLGVDKLLVSSDNTSPTTDSEALSVAVQAAAQSIAEMRVSMTGLTDEQFTVTA